MQVAPLRGGAVAVGAQDARTSTQQEPQWQWQQAARDATDRPPAVAAAARARADACSNTSGTSPAERQLSSPLTRCCRCGLGLLHCECCIGPVHCPPQQLRSARHSSEPPRACRGALQPCASRVAARRRPAQKHLGRRYKFGFRPPRTGRRGEALGETRNSMWSRVASLFDPTVTSRTLINEGAVFGAFALWCAARAAHVLRALPRPRITRACSKFQQHRRAAGRLPDPACLPRLPCTPPLRCSCAARVLFSSDQSFPLAGAFAYSVYQFQSKRVKRNPDGPFFGGNAIVGAIFSTLACLALACAVRAAAAQAGCLAACGLH